MRITVFGNCQTPVLSEFMGLQCPQAQMIPCPRVHLVPLDAPQEVYAAFDAADVVVHQPISDRFGPIGMDALKARFPDKTYVSFPSIYFAGLSPQMINMNKLGRARGVAISGWHDTRVLRAYLSGLSAEACVDLLANDTDDYRDDWDKAWATSRAYDQGVDIPVMDLVNDMLAEGPMFHVANHPGNALLWKVAQAVLTHLDLPVAAAKMPPVDVLNGQTNIVPAGIPRRLGLDWTRDFPESDGKPIALADYVAGHYATYAGLKGIHDIRIEDLADTHKGAERQVAPNLRGAGNPVQGTQDERRMIAIARSFWACAYRLEHPDSTPLETRAAWVAVATDYYKITRQALRRLDRQGIVFDGTFSAARPDTPVMEALS